jgi:ubiquitin carboxyl-terminal hydrolase 8
VNTVHVGKQINARVRERGFGGSTRQHDSIEFFLFVIDILMDELNPTRNLDPWVLTDENEIRKFNLEPSRLWAANLFRQHTLRNNTSPLVMQTDIMEMGVIVCNQPHCRKERRNFQNNPMLKMTVKPEPAVQRLVDALVLDIGPRSEEVIHFGCEYCGERKPGLNKFGQPRSPIIMNDNGTSSRYHTWLPDYLWISLNRYGLFSQGIQKIETTITFPETGIDLTETFTPALANEPHPLPRQQTGPFKYDVYAVIQHRGNNISHGHYWTLARSFDKPKNGAGSWHKFNDSHVSPATFYDTQNSTTAAIFLRRQGS